MKRTIKCVSLLGLLCCASPAWAATRVFFDKDEYVVSAVGENFDVQILIDADDRTPEIEPVRGGLFSFGTELVFDPAKAEVSGPAAVKTTAELDNFGFFSGAYTEVAAGRAGAKGNIDQVANPLVPYEGSLLATLTLTNKAAPVDLYPLQLDFFRTLGATEQLFVDGTGTALDSNLVFGEAVVRVVPEPTTVASGLIGFLLLLLSCFRRAHDACP